MNHTQFLEEIFSGLMPIHSRALQAFLPEYISYLEHGSNAHLSQDEKKDPKLSLFNSSISPISGDGVPQNEKTVAVIPIIGMITRYGSWWNWGANEYERMFNEAYSDDSIAAIVMSVHCPGGSTHAMPIMENIIKEKNKPVIAAVDNMAFSAAYYFSLFADQIIAVGDMSEVGSIGVMASFMDNREALKKFGYNVVEVYPPESSWKNKAVNEAIDGKPELLITEGLSPWAQYYQEKVKEMRPKLDQSVEGIIEGKTFYAKDALKYGLIDGIMPMNKIIKKAFELGTRQQFSNSINN